MTAKPPNDLGFGSSPRPGRQGRLLRRDGTFAAERTGLPVAESFGLYHYLLTTTWPRFIALLSISYIAVNGIFAWLYFSLGSGGLKGGVATDSLGRFAESFFFSVHTLATIGYGNIVPGTLAANLIDTAESLIGLLGLSIIAGVVFGRVSRPVAGVRFSDVAVIAPYQGGTGLMFRLANVRRNELIHIQVEVSLSLIRPDGTRAFFSLDLERKEVVFMATSWTVVHPIDAESPLAGMDRETFFTTRPEIFALVTATEEVFSQVVHARSSYADEEIRWGAKFAQIVRFDDPGNVAKVDLSRLSEIDPVALPARLAAPPAVG